MSLGLKNGQHYGIIALTNFFNERAQSKWWYIEKKWLYTKDESKDEWEIYNKKYGYSNINEQCSSFLLYSFIYIPFNNHLLCAYNLY